MRIKLVKKVESNGLVTYEVTPPKLEYQLALSAITSWKNSQQLVEFAVNKHGYGNTDSMSGITYESDLDEYDKKETIIGTGNVEVYSQHFTPQEMIITEKEYLQVLQSYFEVNKEIEFANMINSEIENQKL